MQVHRAIAKTLIVTLLVTSTPSPFAFSQTAPAPNTGRGAEAPPVLFYEAPLAPAPQVVGAKDGNTVDNFMTEPGQEGVKDAGQLGAPQALEFAAASASSIKNYLLGPGDRLGVHIIVGDNALNLDYQFVVSPAGTIFFPAIGEINVSGFRYGQFKNHLRSRIQKKFNERFELSVILEGIRRVQVNVFGQVQNPGPRVVSALARVGDVIA